VKSCQPYQDVGAAEYEKKHAERELAALRRRAAKLGFTLTPQA
jgi:hypothetical protein